MKDVTYLSEIISALEKLNGTGSLSEICEIIESNDKLSAIHTNKAWKNNVSNTIQTHYSQTLSYKGYTDDIFYSVYGVGKGYWGLRKYRRDYSTDEIYSIESRIIKSIESSKINKTEKEMLIKARTGQGIFRSSLIQKYGKCIVTGIDDERLLIASHIKPWRLSNNIERLSPENGLLLSALYDKLFDSGLISFDENMRILISPQLSTENREIINPDTNRRYIANPSDELQCNMEFHRKYVYIK
ncbi:MAG: HNH endonuclease [Ruminococcus sp.]|nr:HNH endonuclease [Ruminococcus sp.]